MEECPIRLVNETITRNNFDSHSWPQKTQLKSFISIKYIKTYIGVIIIRLVALSTYLADKSKFRSELCWLVLFHMIYYCAVECTCTCTIAHLKCKRRRKQNMDLDILTVGPKMWNGLHLELRSIENMELFKKNFD